jgi:hypothetical protein
VAVAAGSGFREERGSTAQPLMTVFVPNDGQSGLPARRHSVTEEAGGGSSLCSGWCSSALLTKETPREAAPASGDASVRCTSAASIGGE